MIGMISWITTSITTASDYTYSSALKFQQHVYAYASAVSNAVTANMYSGLDYVFPPTLRSKAADFITSVTGEAAAVYAIEGWEGATQILNPLLHPGIFFQPKTGRVTWNALWSNIGCSMAPAAAYMAIVQPFLPKDSWKINAAEQLVFMSRRISTVANGAMSFVSLSTALSEEIPPNPNFPPCKHVKDDPAVGIKSDAMSILYYGAKQGVVAAISAIPVVGQYVVLPVKALVYGEALVESRLSGLCTEERHAALARNHAYAFGFGAALTGLAFVTSWLINSTLEKYTFKEKGSNPIPLLDDAIFTLAYMWCMVAAQLINKSLPGKPLPPKSEPGKPAIKKTAHMRDGTDLFRIPRKMTDVLISEIADTVAPMLAGSKGNTYEQIKAALDTSPAHFVRWILLPGSLNSLDDAMGRSDATILLDFYEKKIRDAIKEVRNVNKSGGVQFYKIMKGWGVAQLIVSTATAGLLDNVILHKDLLDTLEYLERRLDSIHRKAHLNEKRAYAEIESAPPYTLDRPYAQMQKGSVAVDAQPELVVASASAQAEPVTVPVIVQAKPEPVSQTRALPLKIGGAGTSRSSLFAVSSAPAPVQQAQSEMTLRRPMMRLGPNQSLFSRSEASLPTLSSEAAFKH